jgi:hypothetical protein
MLRSSDDHAVEHALRGCCKGTNARLLLTCEFTEHKSMVMKIWYFYPPHFPAFHFSWVAFFAAFMSTFAPAALLPVIRENLDLTSVDLGNAGVAAVCGAIASRVAMGNFVGECRSTGCANTSAEALAMEGK